MLHGRLVKDHVLDHPDNALERKTLEIRGNVACCCFGAKEKEKREKKT